MSLELEVLDQLQGGDLPLPVIKSLFADDLTFSRAMLGLLGCGDIRLVTRDGAAVPSWQWRELFAERQGRKDLTALTVQLTDQGGKRIE